MKILLTPDPFLRHKAKEVTTITAQLTQEVEEMFVILKNSRDPQGVGLAATQVGLDRRLFVLLDGRKRQIFINPKITKSSRKMISAAFPDKDDRWLEGCLSMPKIWGFVDRPNQVTVQYQDLDLKTHSQTFTDIEAAYVQHEIDHLNGILFTDHILKQRGQLFHETKKGLVPLELA